MIRLKLIGDAIASAAQTMLSDEARGEWDGNDNAVTWKLANIPGTDSSQATGSAHISRRSLQVEDEQVFLAWLQGSFPQEIVSTLRVRNPKWLEGVRAILAESVAAGRAETPPGAKLDEGGEFRSFAIVPDGTVKRRLREAVRRAIAIGATLDPDWLWTYATGETDEPV